MIAHSVIYCKPLSHLASEGLSKHFWPERLEIIEEMPRTPTGKIQKFVLRELARSLAVSWVTVPVLSH